MRNLKEEKKEKEILSLVSISDTFYELQKNCLSKKKETVFYFFNIQCLNFTPESLCRPKASKDFPRGSDAEKGQKKEEAETLLHDGKRPDVVRECLSGVANVAIVRVYRTSAK